MGRRWSAAPDEGTKPRDIWKQHAGLHACPPPSFISHIRMDFAPRTLTPTPLPRGEGLQAVLHRRVEDFQVMEATYRGGSVAGDWRRAAHGCAAAASQTGCLTEPRSQSPAALPPLPKPLPTGIVPRRTLTPAPRSAPQPAPAARALRGTRANGAQAVPHRPAGRGACSLLPSKACSLLPPGHCPSSWGRRWRAAPMRVRAKPCVHLTPPAAPAPDPPADHRYVRSRSTTARCLR